MFFEQRMSCHRLCFFCQSNVSANFLVRKMRVELTRYCYHRYLKPARLPFRHFRIFNFGLNFVKTQTFVFAQVSETARLLPQKYSIFGGPRATTTPKIFLFLGDPGFATSAYLILVCASSKHKPLFLRRL